MPWSAALLAGVVAIQCRPFEERADDTKEIGLVPGVPLAPHDVDRPTKLALSTQAFAPNIRRSETLSARCETLTGAGREDDWGHGTQHSTQRLESEKTRMDQR
jgi:hypothetical protein